MGASVPFLTHKLWEEKVEHKCKLFTWFFLHGKAFTVEQLVVRGWPHEGVCCLCNTEFKTNEHLALCCYLNRGVGDIVAGWFSITANLTPDFSSLKDCWNIHTVSVEASARKHFSKVLIYVPWHVWKERNRQFFPNKTRQVLELAYLVKEGLNQQGLAFATAM